MGKAISDTVVIIPAYNEAGMVGEMVRDCLAAGFSRVVVVDDGSDDETARVAAGSGATVLTHALGLGAGGATQTGIEYALGLGDVKYFATIDADRQHRAGDLVGMRVQLVKNGDDIVIGSRFMEGGEVENIPALKKALLRAAIWFSNATSGTKFTDTHNGIRIFNRRVAETIDIEESGYQFCSEILDKIARNNYVYSEHPVRVTYTEYSKAKGQSILNAVNIGFDVLGRKIIGK
ncbi:glycosyltransferase family 2 protein [Candidatus Saccharibacteria bacterium]|nr:glycosyltransferase family 2 protein [Candidatus Saccharibacteria bacterium]